MPTPRREWFPAAWDARSDQPHVLRDSALKRRLRRQAWREHARVLATALWAGPTVAARALWPGQFLTAARQWPDFIGCGVSPHPQLPDLVQELGLRHLLIRCPLGCGAAQQQVLETINAMPAQQWLVVIPQDRWAVCNPRPWAAQLAQLVQRLPAHVVAVQIGNAVNRMKWGCATVAEYLDLVEVAAPLLRARRPDCLLVGSAVIDFEPLLSLRSLINGYRHSLDVVSSLLYVDRRGGPDAFQYGLFDTAAKIRTVAAMVACAPRHGKRLWITEVNWPLRGYPGWAPTSDHECVDEADAGRYLSAYLQTAWQSRLVERVYPWQLIARGYGLVDDSGPSLRRRPAFHALRSLLATGESA